MRNLKLLRLDRSRARRGMAPLEFVMALPVLLLLIVGITWLGFSVIGQTEVLIEARNKAWKRRFEDASKKPLMFPSGVSVAKNPFYSVEADYVTETSTKKVDVSPMFSRLPGPRASHTILAGSWDYRAMPFDKAPEWELLAKAAANGTTGDLQTWLTKLKDPLGQLKDLGGSILADNSRRTSEVESSDAGSGSGPNGGKVDQAKEENEREREAEKKKYQQRLRELGGRTNLFNNQVTRTYPDGELGRTIDELEAMEINYLVKSKATPLQDEAEEKKRLDELDRLERGIGLLKGKRQRIESEIRDTEAELRALG